MKLGRIMILSMIISSVVHANIQYNPKQAKKFFDTNECIGCDLSNLTICNGPGTPTDKENHSGAILNNANLSGVTAFNINLSASSLKNVNFSGAFLECANFSEADLTGAHFDGANVGGANFFGAKGVDLTHAARACDVTLPDGKRTESC